MDDRGVRRGVYFLANDAFLDQAIAFLCSFRLNNPTIPLCLIPFDDATAEISALADEYGFTVWDKPEVLQRCDEISVPFHGRVLGQYRKLAAWHGDFDQFIYIDSDTVVLHEIDFVFDLLHQYEFVTTHSDIPGIRKFVWNDSIYESGVLDEDQIAFATNTGFVASSRGLLDVDDVLGDLDKALEIAPHMALDFYEQPFLNYLMVTSGKRYVSLYVISVLTQDEGMPTERWAGEDIGEFRDGRMVSHRRPTLLVHWAGEWDRVRREGGQVRYYDLWRFYRLMHRSGSAESCDHD